MKFMWLTYIVGAEIHWKHNNRILIKKHGLKNEDIFVDRMFNSIKYK